MTKLTIDKLKPGMITAAPITTKRGQTIAASGTALTPQLISKLTFYKISEVCVEDIVEPEPEPAAPAIEQSHNTEKETAENISYTHRLKASPKFQQFQMDYALNIEYLKENFEVIKEGAGSECSDLLLENAESLFKSRTSLELFDTIYLMHGPEDSVYAHSLNVALISRAIGKWLRLPRTELDVLTLAGLLHDIGKTEIPEEILNKPGRYTDEEFKLVQSHPLLSNKILKGKGFDTRITLAALQHHERQDGSGYPRGLTSDEIDDFASIVAIADVYDAMTAARSYRNPLCPFQVISEFQKDGLSKYNTQYILTFLERVASTYQNSRVILSNGQSGRVVYINKRNLSRPVIELDDKTIVDLANSTNSELSITSMI